MNAFLDRLMVSSQGGELAGAVKPRLRSLFEDNATLIQPEDERPAEWDARLVRSVPAHDQPPALSQPARRASSEWPGERAEAAPHFPSDFPSDEMRLATPKAVSSEERDPERPVRQPLLVPRMPDLSSPLMAQPLAEARLAQPADGQPVVPAERITTRLERIEQMAQTPIGPALVPAETPPAAEPPAPVVRVAIGRIEVHAPPPAPPPRPAAPSSPPRTVRPVRSLDAYLKNRNEGRR